MKVPITKAVFDERDLAIIQEPLKSGWVVQGPYVKRFEDLFANYVGAPHAVATTSCTTALHLALLAAGVKAGDDVLLPALTFVATANAVAYVGARPVFCDIDLNTFNISATEIERRITPATRAVIPVHLFGLAADMDAIMGVARSRRLAVIEDAACAFGTRYRGAHAGTIGDIGCFSFHPRKAITTGEGGMISTKSADLAARCRSLRDHGATRSDLSRHGGRGAFLLSDYDELGYNYRMTDLQGALGCSQMEKADAILAARKYRARRYGTLLSDCDRLRLPIVPVDNEHSFQSYVCLYAPMPLSLQTIDKVHQTRNRILLELEDQGVSTRQGTHAVTGLGLYRKRLGIRPEDFPNAWIADRASITLPLFASMTDAEQDHVVERLGSALETRCAA